MSTPVTAPRHRHSPRVRRLASENGLDPDTLGGSGPRGRVTPADVVMAVASLRTPASAAVAGHTQVVEVDVTRVLAHRDTSAGVVASTAIMAKAVLESLRAHPLLNGRIGADGRAVRQASLDLGVEIDTPNGRLVLVLGDAGVLNLAGLTRRLSQLAERTLAGQVRPSELTGASFTFIDNRDRAVLFDTPVLNGSQLAVLSVGMPVDRPVVVRNDNNEPAIVIRSMVHLALTHDRTVIGGADATAFLGTLKAKLEVCMFR